jgi:sulfonate transport system permease protein
MLRRTGLGIAVLLLLLLLAEALARAGWFNPVLFPPPSRIALAYSDPSFATNVAMQSMITVGRAATGFFAALFVAVPAGLALGASASLRAALTPTIELLRPIPSSAMVPVSILFLGLGSPMILFVIWFGTLWPLLMNTMYGARSVDIRHQELAKLLRLSRVQYFGLIVLPSAIPHIFAGARVAISIALILAVTAEMLAGQNGLGFFLLDYERAFRYPEMYATLVLLAVIGLGINVGFVGLQSILKRRFPLFG